MDEKYPIIFDQPPIRKVGSVSEAGKLTESLARDTNTTVKEEWTLGIPVSVRITSRLNIWEHWEELR